MIPVTIRSYRDDDFLEILKLETDGGHEPYRSAVFVRQMGIICPDTFLIATLEKEQVGYAIGALVHGNPREAWILRMGVRADQRRNGVGSILLAELMETFRLFGVRTVRLTVSPWNVPALMMYQKASFTQETYHEAYFGKDEDRIVLVKEIR
ncbi:MAG: GNAT family N-acetyltransferase [Methanoregulaceae archaeon]|nr:GNAT family N-acetyltransferase [Methanoregulaceae archaeon]